MTATARAALVRSLCARLNDERRSDLQIRAVDELLMAMEREDRGSREPMAFENGRRRRRNAS